MPTRTVYDTPFFGHPVCEHYEDITEEPICPQCLHPNWENAYSKMAAHYQLHYNNHTLYLNDSMLTQAMQTLEQHGIAATLTRNPHDITDILSKIFESTLPVGIWLTTNQQKEIEKTLKSFH